MKSAREASSLLVSCGEALVDLVPEAVPGGGPMNAAVAAARLGANAAFVGRVSTDGDGDTIWGHLLANGVDLSAAERGEEPTARVIVEHTPKTTFRFEGDGTADTNLSAVHLDRLDGDPAVVHGGTLGMFRGRTAETLAQLVEGHPGLVSLDPNVRPQLIDDRPAWEHFHQRWIAHTDIYKASDEDLAWIWPGRTAAEVAEELFAGGLSVFLLTEGPVGATAFTSDGAVSVPGRTVEVIDTVGAGDTFIATILTGLIERGVNSPQHLTALTADNWESLLRRAALAAAITCSRSGADPPTAAELLAWEATS